MGFERGDEPAILTERKLRQAADAPIRGERHRQARAGRCGVMRPWIMRSRVENCRDLDQLVAIRSFQAPPPMKMLGQTRGIVRVERDSTGHRVGSTIPGGKVGGDPVSVDAAVRVRRQQQPIPAFAPQPGCRLIHGAASCSARMSKRRRQVAFDHTKRRGKTRHHRPRKLGAAVIAVVEEENDAEAAGRKRFPRDLSLRAESAETAAKVSLFIPGRNGDDGAELNGRPC